MKKRTTKKQTHKQTKNPYTLSFSFATLSKGQSSSHDLKPDYIFDDTFKFYLGLHYH